MNKKDSLKELMIVFIGIVVILAGSIVFILIRLNKVETLLASITEPTAPMGLEIGSDAPAFKITTIEGEELDSKVLFTQPTMLIFSSTACPHCQNLFPYIKKFTDKHPSQQILMFSLGSKEDIEKMVQDNDFKFPIAEWSDGISTQYQVPGTPLVYFVGTGGKIISSGFPASLEDLEGLASAKPIN